MMTASFEPEAFLVVSDPRTLKGFTDPIRVRLLHILGLRAATNQQLAAALGEPQAKVLHHVRLLVELGLVVLVEQRIRGGNVEKYYRATATLYGFRPDPGDVAELSAPVSGAVLESVTQELAASLQLWPDQDLYWETRRRRLAPDRVAEFNARLMALVHEFWDTTPADPAAEMMAVALTLYRFPGAVDVDQASDGA